MLREYIDALAEGILSLNLGIEPRTAALLGKIAVYSIVIYTIAALVILAGRFTKQLHIVNGIGVKAISAGCMLFFLYAVTALYMARGAFFDALSSLHPKNLLVMLRHLDQTLIYFFVPAVIGIVVYAILFAMLKFCFSICVGLFQDNIRANGAIKGTALSIYELFSGVVWLALILCAFSLGIAIVLLPIALLLASTAGHRDVAYYYYD